VKIGLKSSQENLQKRGMASKLEIEELSVLSQIQLIELLHSNQAVTRTASAYNLYSEQEEVTEELLKQLQIETCLYTKIAICESLEKGNIKTARQMVEYLGKIGDNRHKELPDTVSKKKSYPMPRDIIARSLGKMDVTVFPVLNEVLNSKDIIKISDALDAIGYMVFYHPQLATLQNADAILYLAESYTWNRLIPWKAMMCLSAFGLKESKECLLRFSNDNTIIGMEARRSLRIMDERLRCNWRAD
jgi:hypothetical protein